MLSLHTHYSHTTCKQLRDVNMQLDLFEIQMQSGLRMLDRLQEVIQIQFNSKHSISTAAHGKNNRPHMPVHKVESAILAHGTSPIGEANNSNNSSSEHDDHDSCT